MTGTTGKMVCLNCFEFKNDCKCLLPDIRIRKPEWIKEQRMLRNKEVDNDG